MKDSDLLEAMFTLVNKFPNMKFILLICNLINRMVIISKSILVEFGLKHTDSIDALNKWYDETKKADWNNFPEIKKTFNSVDYVGNDRYVFNLKGNKYRLVGMVFFDVRTVYVRFIGTHAEYDKIDCSRI